MKFLNAVSVNMVPSGLRNFVMEFREIDIYDVQGILDDGVKIESYIGHRETAEVLTLVLGHRIPMERRNAIVQESETAVLCQYCGDRLPEGATTLPPGARFRFFLVEVHEELPE